MIEIVGLVLTTENHLVGYLVKKDNTELFVSDKTIISWSTQFEIRGGYIRTENYGGELHTFIDLDEEVTENLLYEDEALQKHKSIL